MQRPGQGRRERRPEAAAAALSSGTGARCLSAGCGVRGSASGGRRRGVGLRAECADSPSGRWLSLDGTGRGRGRGHARPSGRLRPRSPGAPLRPRCGGRLRPLHPSAAPHRAPTCSRGMRWALRRPSAPRAPSLCRRRATGS